jgi:3D-(3,5/4)-trihydroxycyclohexane-1,2-dione acylhydrolase (decyclizing)
MKDTSLSRDRRSRARAVREAGSLEEAVRSGQLKRRADVTLSEALVLGLLRQGVRRFIAVLGHGSTEIGEVLRIYEEEQLLRTFGVRNEIEASHAATALRWVTGEKSAVVTSIGPGALQAMAASLVPASNGTGVWYLFGDETTEDEGPNFQQVPKPEQQLYLRVTATLGDSYVLHTPRAVTSALRRGGNVVDDPYRAGPFFLLLPMNTQAALIEGFDLLELPVGTPPTTGPALSGYKEAVNVLAEAKRVVVKVGGGAVEAGAEICELLDLVDGVAVLSPRSLGVVPYEHPRNMTVGGSKGSISGNWAGENGDLLIAIGTRAVCQSDCSGTAYPNASTVINVNVDADAALHYPNSIPLVGDARLTLQRLNEALRAGGRVPDAGSSEWFVACREKRREWDAYLSERTEHPRLFDEALGACALTQPAAIKLITDWARGHDVPVFLDAGEPQGFAFQVAEDDRVGRSYTDGGASYMGFAASAVLSSALAEQPFYALAISGDGSFTMNPQILIDGVAHGARGAIVVLDNRRMSAISRLQEDQYGVDYATWDGVPVDYVRWASAVPGVTALHGGDSLESLQASLDEAFSTGGLALVHVPVYYGPDPLGTVHSFGRWNVGPWSVDVQALRHEIGAGAVKALATAGG